MAYVIGVTTALVALYVAALAALIVARPAGLTAVEAVRLMPNTVGLVARMAQDRQLPPSARAAVWALAAYLALPFDLVPDFIPVVGYADDVILVCLTLRFVVRRAGSDAIRRHWRGTAEGLKALARFAGLELHSEPEAPRTSD